MRGTGRRTSSTVKEWKHGLTRQSIKANTETVKSTERECLIGKMIAATMGSSRITTSMAMESTAGRTDESTRENGAITRWRAKESLPGWTAGATRATTRTTRKKDTGCLLSEMDGFTRANGRIASNTGEASLRRKTSKGKESGKRERGSSGVMKKKILLLRTSPTLRSDQDAFLLRLRQYTFL